MRKLILVASAGAIGTLLALSPAFALTSYQINTDNQANFQDPDSKSPINGLTVTSNTEDAYGNTVNNFNSTTSQQEDLSRDMSWQGTGYYLRPNR